MQLIVIDRDPAGANDLKLIALDQQGRIVINADAQDVGMSVADIHQLAVALGRCEVRVDGHVPQKTKASLVSHRDQQWFVRTASHHKRALDDRARGAAENDTAACQKFLEFSLRKRIEIRIREAARIAGGKIYAG